MTKEKSSLMTILFDWEDRISHYGKLIILCIIAFFLIKVGSDVVSFLNDFKKTKAAELKLLQEQVEGKPLADGSASSSYSVQTQKILDEAVAKLSKEMKSELDKIHADVRAIREIQVVGTSSGIVGATPGSEIQNNIPVKWENYKDRNDPGEIAKHEVWIQFNRLEEQFEYDVHHNFTITQVSAEVRDNNTLRSYVKAVNNYTGKTLSETTIDTKLEEYGFTKNLDLPDWSMFFGTEVSSRGKFSVDIGVGYGSYDVYVRKEFDASDSTGAIAVGINKRINLSKWFRKYPIWR